SKLYIGNLSWNTTDDTLRQAFGEYGTVTDSKVMRDRETGRSRGFGFVTFNSSEEADGAMAALHEQELDGRRVKVNKVGERDQQSGGQHAYNNQGARGYGSYNSTNQAAGHGGYGG
ncbi:hypothetical protein BJ085DRAFT_541, partial [Dimargaris cristalligena]